jgi:hypothetical protein
MIAPIFSGPAGVGLGVALDVGVGPDVVAGVGVEVAISVGVVGVDIGLAFSFPPQAANIKTIKTKARARDMNLYHKLLFGHMVNYLLLRHR